MTFRPPVHLFLKVSGMLLGAQVDKATANGGAGVPPFGFEVFGHSDGDYLGQRGARACN